MKRILPLLLIIALSQTACSDKKNKTAPDQSENRQRMETEAAGRLVQARNQLISGEYERAAETIRTMRRDCYLAIDARRQGILLMDSVDLALARRELSRTDSLIRTGCDTVKKEDFEEACRKVQFYERKIRHDKAQQPAGK